MNKFIIYNQAPIYQHCSFTTNHYHQPDTSPMAQDSPSECILPIPKEGKYTEVRKYIQERSRFDDEFRRTVEKCTRVELCIYLTDLFGWDVDPHHLGVNMNRNR